MTNLYMLAQSLRLPPLFNEICLPNLGVQKQNREHQLT